MKNVFLFLILIMSTNVYASLEGYVTQFPKDLNIIECHESSVKNTRLCLGFFHGFATQAMLVFKNNKNENTYFIVENSNKLKNSSEASSDASLIFDVYPVEILSDNKYAIEFSKVGSGRLISKKNESGVERYSFEFINMFSTTSLRFDGFEYLPVNLIFN